MKKNKRGITLIEALFVLGIMAIIIGIVMILLSQTTQRNKVNELFNEGYTLKQAVISLCDSDTTCMSNIDNSSILKSGLIPNKYISGQNIVDPWGAPIQNISIPTWIGASSVAIAQIYVPSKEQCIQIMSFVNNTDAWKLTGYNQMYPNPLDYCNSTNFPGNLMVAL